MISLTTNPIDVMKMLDAVGSVRAGAVVLFLGTVREITGSELTKALDYECYPAMAEKKLAELENEARRRWPIVECGIVHRLGRLEPSEISIAIAVSTPHRREAFAAGEWLIDTLKRTVPIWKKEEALDGSQQWVHPGVTPPC